MNGPLVAQPCPVPAEDESAPTLDFVRMQPAEMPGESADGARVLEVYHLVGDAVVDVALVPAGGKVTLSGAGGAGRLAAPRELLPFDDLTVFEPVPAEAGGGWAARFAPGWEGARRRGGAQATLAELVSRGEATREPDGLYRLAIAPADQVELGVGRVWLVARPVRPGRKVAPPDRLRADPAPAGILGFVVVALGLLGVALGTIPEAPAASRLDLDQHVVTTLLRTLPEPPAVLPDRPKPEVGEARGGGARSARPPGRPGPARDRGGPGVMDALQRGPLADMLGDSSLSSDVTAGIDRLVGTRATGGRVGLAGRNLGGGGELGTADFGGGGGPGRRRGGGGGDDESWGGRAVTRGEGGDIGRAGDVITIGAIQPSVIDQVVKRHLASIRYCYQRELQKQPTLAGKLSVKFTIAADGSVSSATAASTTLGSPAVEACVAGRFLKMEFPPLKGGGVAVVRYPFWFSPG